MPELTLPPPPANLRELGLAVSTARRSRGLTLEDLAERAGISRQTVINIEMAHKAARIDTLHAIAHALEVPLSDLIAHL